MNKNKSNFLIIVATLANFILIYIFYLILKIENPLFFIILAISSVAVISTSTIYTVIQSTGHQNERELESRLYKKPRPTKAKYMKLSSTDIIEDYLHALPVIGEYVESDISYKESPVIEKIIFTLFSKEELDKINLLSLSNAEKMLFLREMLYFEPEEREDLIESMLKNRDKTDEELIYIPPKKTIEVDDKIRVHVISLIEPGEKMKILIVDKTDLIITIKEKIGVLFDYDMEVFLLSSGGIILSEDSQINNYILDDDDEIVLIPSKKKR